MIKAKFRSIKFIRDDVFELENFTNLFIRNAGNSTATINGMELPAGKTLPINNQYEIGKSLFKFSFSSNNPIDNALEFSFFNIIKDNDSSIACITNQQ